jgi:hypothetical protein
VIGHYIGDTWTGCESMPHSRDWDKRLPTCKRLVPPRVLRYLSERCAAGLPVNFPDGDAGRELHRLVFYVVKAAECSGGERQERDVSWSILMGLTEEGGFKP